MQKIPIIIFIHGTLPPQTAMSIPPVYRFFRCPEGLTGVQNLPDSHIKDILSLMSNTLASVDDCYAFGWSGKLSHQARIEAGRHLMKALLKLTREHQKQGKELIINLITHSHGGNVALCLAHAADTGEDEIAIEQLIMLACPVQLETTDYTNDELFKNVFSIHSHHDLLQVMDPQGLHTFYERLKTFGLEFTLRHLQQLGPLFSERHFPKSSLVKELTVSYQHRQLLHIEFLLPTFIETLPKLIELLMNEPKGSQELNYIFKNEPHRSAP